MRRLLVAVLLAGSSAALLAPPAGAEVDAGAEAGFVSSLNAVRQGQGLPPLEVSAELTAKARAWSQVMADSGHIFHSNLSDGISSPWSRLGENVGVGPNVGSVHDAFVASPAHYSNLVDPGFRYVGVGVVSINGTLWVTEVFMEPASQPAPSSPVPATGTPSSSPDASVPVAPVEPVPAAPPPPSAQLTANLDRLRGLEG
jgi:hypothetical protein